MSERRKIILHIGAGKTGSTAIQNFLSLNADALRKAGIVIPDGDLNLTGEIHGNHVPAMQRLLSKPGSGRRKLEAAIRDIHERTDGATILISAENLVAQVAAPSLFEGLAKDHDIEVILYIRRQDDFLLSGWQQWHAKVRDDFWAWLIAVVGSTADWRAYLIRWEKVIPRDKIKVRLFDRKKMEGGDVVSDFFSLLGLSAPFDSFAYPHTVINPSFADPITELVKGNKTIFRDAHDNRFQNFVHYLTGDRFVKDSKESKLTAAQRRAIVTRYAASNRWVQENYFGNKAGDLFAPIKDSDYFYPDSKTMRRRQLEFVVTILFRYYRFALSRRKNSGIRKSPE